MRFNKEQMETLATYEDYFRTAVNSAWARYPGQTALEQIHAIYTGVTGDRRLLSTNCSTCILHLLQDCGKLYFADKQEMIDKQNEAIALEYSTKEMRGARVSVGKVGEKRTPRPRKKKSNADTD